MKHWMLSPAIVLLLTQFLFAADSLQITTNRADGTYAVGEKITWTISRPDKASSDSESNDALKDQWPLTYTVLEGGLQKIQSGSISESDLPFKITASRKTPGTLLLVIPTKDAKGKQVDRYGAAVVAPKKISVSKPAPEDFDLFWKSKIDELNSVPFDTVLEKIDVGDDKIEYYKITMNNIRGKKIYGQIAKPKDGKNLPALLQVQWAGVYPLQRDWILWRARNGWISMNISAHDLPIDEPEQFYQEQSNTALKDYPGMGNEDRETSYFLPMFLACRRAVDYLIQRDDWNQRTVLVHGGSQGGYQAIVTAGLHPAVTAFAANVPAGCDHTGAFANRSPGWPSWASRTWQGKNAAKMLEASRYFDAMNFASRAKCDALVGVGLIDTVCPAEGVIATYNQLAGTKQLVVMPNADHGGDHKAYVEAFDQFMAKHKSVK